MRNDNSLLACLAFAQFRNVDFTGISWAEGQGKLGDGGQASVLQTRADAKAVLAFRRHTPPQRGILGRLYDSVSKSRSASVVTTNAAYRQIASEILALGHPELRSHPNIVQLIAISWEIREEWPSKTEIWPVLIFEKARYKDLEKFVRDPKQTLRKKETLSTKNRLKICADIAAAMAVVHQNDIIHGDVKPQNVLVFGESEETIVAKVADFGFATVASNDKIDVATSTPWVAPEVGSRDGHTLEQAKKTDIYSFGMLCLWVLFRERLEEIEMRIRELGKKYEVAPDIDVLKKWNVADTSANKVQHFALDLAKKLPSDDLKLVVERVFRETLSVHSDERGDFITIARYLAQNKQVASPEDHPHHEVKISTTSFPSPSNFKVSDALQSLCLADPRVRKGIFYSLLHDYQNAKGLKEKSDLAIQLAFCKNIGFGTSKDVVEAERYIREAETLVPDRSLSTCLEDARHSTWQKQEPSNDLLKKLYSTGVIQPVHNAVDFRSLTETQQMAMREARKKEFEDMEASLGTTHPAVLNLKWTYSTMLMERGGDEIARVGVSEAQSDFLKAIAHDLADDAAYGENHIDTVMAEAYYAFSLLVIPSFDAMEESIQRCLRLRHRLRDVGRKHHVITVTICKHLSACLNRVLRFEEAEKYFEEAKEGTKAIFGADHPNTVVLLMDEAQNYVQQGNTKEAEETHRKCLRRLLGQVDEQEPQESLEPLLTDKSMEFLPLQGQLVKLLVMSGNFNMAQKELHYIKKLLDHHKFDEKHPAYINAHQMSMRISIGLGKYEEADRDANKCLTIMSRFPWPPPTNVVLPDLPHPSLFPRDPNMMLVEAIRFIALVARYHDAAAASENGLAASLKEVDGCLTKLLREINQCLGSKDKAANNAVDPAAFARGLAGSAMYQAMEEGPSIPVELLAFLGADNARDGLHYAMAIRVARRLGMLRAAAVLEEHQAVCSPISLSTAIASDNGSFKTLEDLDAWIAGDWMGTYLTKGGLRKGLRWKRTLHLRQIKNEEEVGEAAGSEGKEEQPLAPDTLRIGGTADDEEAGQWTIRGSASTSGKMTLYFHLTNLGTPKHAWEYAGRLHQDRRAFGGHWGIQGHEMNHAEAGGSFFFYKI